MGGILATIVYATLAALIVIGLLRPITRLVAPHAKPPDVKDQVGLLFVTLAVAPMATILGTAVVAIGAMVAQALLRWMLPKALIEQLEHAISSLPSWAALVVPVGIYGYVVVNAMIQVAVLGVGEDKRKS